MFSGERQREAGYKLPRWRRALKTQKPVPATYILCIPIGGLFFFQSQARNEVFWQRPDPKIRVGMLRTEVGALFRTGTIRLTPDLPLSTPIKLPEWPA